ncbi:hypothetical protein SDC9_95961 [bioreactor metagenome]|uniref:Uncharacterized protein n=1 Tax=bioreactor metagenome TaxID=1076179 RepID=A0A645AEG6_9ZZZZ
MIALKKQRHFGSVFRLGKKQARNGWNGAIETGEHLG